MIFIFCLLIGLFMTSISTHANPQNGIYLNEEKDRCILICDSLVYIYRPAKTHLYEQVTYSECRIVEVSKPFFKINSIKNPTITAFQDMSIVCSPQQNILKDCEYLEIRIRFPQYHQRLRINVYTNKSQVFTYDYYSNEVIRLPRNGLSTVSFEIINPLDFIILQKELYGSIPYYASDSIAIDDGTSALSITLPSINEDLFTHTFIQGEYIKYSSNCLEWENEKYYRVNY